MHSYRYTSELLLQKQQVVVIYIQGSALPFFP